MDKSFANSTPERDSGLAVEQLKLFPVDIDQSTNLDLLTFSLSSSWTKVYQILNLT